MAKFKYNLQSLYNLRIQLEEIAKNKMSKALKELKIQNDLLYKYIDDREICISELIKVYEEGIPGYIAKAYSTYLSQINNKIIRQKENIKLARKNVDTVREELIKATQEREMLEKLRERKYAAYLQEVNKLEQRLTDELVSYKESRKSISTLNS